MSNLSTEISNVTELILGVDYYIPFPAAVVLVYNIIAWSSLVANMLHLFILSFMNREKRQQALPVNYRAFLAILGICDLSLSLSRVTQSNARHQNMMLSNRAYCVFTSIIGHSSLMIGCTSVFMINIDRILAFAKGHQYQSSLYVKHFNKLLGGVILLSLGLYISLGIVFSGRGYRVKGIGTCKMGSEIFPTLGMVSVSIIFIELILICICCVNLLKRTAKALRGQQIPPHAVLRNKVISLTLAAVVVCKLVTWLPIMSTVLTRALKMDCASCESVGQITMAINSLANPVIYGLSNRNYIRFIKALRKKVSNQITPSSGSGTGSSGT